MREKTTNVGHAIQRAMREIEKANSKPLFDFFGGAQWTDADRLPDKMLNAIIIAYE